MTVGTEGTEDGTAGDGAGSVTGSGIGADGMDGATAGAGWLTLAWNSPRAWLIDWTMTLRIIRTDRIASSLPAMG